MDRRDVEEVGYEAASDRGPLARRCDLLLVLYHGDDSVVEGHVHRVLAAKDLIQRRRRYRLSALCQGATTRRREQAHLVATGDKGLTVC